MARKKKTETKTDTIEKVEEKKTEPEQKKELSEQPEQTSTQPQLSIGMVGHVDHGKTTLVQTLSGKWTDTHSEEIKRGITIRLGYADVQFYKCNTCQPPQAYSVKPACPHCNSQTQPVLKISLVDAPGHESLMATMLSGANIMDGALLLISANEHCPQPQTVEHLTALEITGITNLIVLQNKIDLVTEEQAKKNHQEIKTFLKGTPYENAPIIPISAFHNINVDYVIHHIIEHFKHPQHNPTANPLFYVARSFDTNKPGTPPDKMIGGILGGALKQGILKEGDTIELQPGYETEEKNQKVWKPLKTTIAGLMAGGQPVKELKPGGSSSILTQLDPSIVKSDKLVGAVISHPGKLPPLWNTLKLEPHLLTRVVGAKDTLVVDPIKPNELFMLNVNSAATVGTVKEHTKKGLILTLKRPVCANTNNRVTISRRVGNRWRLIGYGIIKG